jgi:hypothetical protein
LRDRRYPFRARLHLAMSGLLGFAAALAPWTARNFLVFREPILINDAAGVIFYGGNADAAIPLFDARDRTELSRATAALERAREDRIASLPPEVRRSPSGLSRALTRAALEERRRNPSGTVRLVSEKAWDWLRPYPDPRFWSPALVVSAGLYYSALFALAGIGLAKSDRRGVAALAIAFLAWTMLVQVSLETSWRYRAALWDPVLLVYASFGAAVLVGRRLEGRGGPLVITDVLRLARDGAYRVASPFEALSRRLTGRTALPPLWPSPRGGGLALRLRGL